MTSTALTAVPPADRPKGRRGWRGGLAAVLAVGVPAMLFAARILGGGTGGGGRDGSRTFHFALNGPPGLGLKAVLAALLLAAAAALLWTARNPRGLVVAVVVLAAALAGTVHVARLFDSAEVTTHEVRALEPGLSRSAVEHRFGVPAGTGHYSDARRDLDCLVWNLAEAPAPPDYRDYALVCFAGDRFELKVFT